MTNKGDQEDDVRKRVWASVFGFSWDLLKKRQASAQAVEEKIDSVLEHIKKEEKKDVC